jgi:putative nucleotidyltransferase with HDIG domain
VLLTVSGREVMSQRAEIIARISSVPPLPSASTEVVRLVCDPEAPSTKVTQAIEYDPSLTTNVLRLANSDSYGAPQSVGTVKEAFSRLVPDNGFESVLKAAVGKIAEGPMMGYDVSGEDLWDHLIGSAIASKRLAQRLNLSLPEHLFTAALTHDIGKVVLGTFPELDPQRISFLALEERITFEQAEQQILGIDHTEVGAYLVEHWRLPTSIVEAVRWHHQPDKPVANPLIVNLVHVADAVCLMAGVGASLDALSYRPLSHSMDRLGLQLNLLDKIVYEVLNELLKVRTLFKFHQECFQ